MGGSVCVTHAQLSPWSSLTQSPPVVEPKARRSPVSSSASRMAVDHVIGMRLRQPLAQCLEALAAVAGARDHQLALSRDAFLVLDLGHEPDGIRVARMHGDGEPEC